MEIIIKKPVKYNAKYVKFSIPIKSTDISADESDRYNVEKFLSYSKYDQYSIDSYQIEGYVDIDTGYLLNWNSVSTDVDIFSKVVDEGKYGLYDENLNYICGYDGYVPKIFECNEIGWGDYFNMTIEPSGHIKHWEYDLDEKLRKLKIEIFENY